MISSYSELFLFFFFSSRRRHTLFDCDCSSNVFFFFSSRRRHTRFDCDWSSDVCSSDLIEALDFLLLIDTRDTLGAPVDVNQDVGAPLGPFVKRDSVFGFIVGLLDSANVALAAGGTSFPFGLPPGFSGFATPVKFIQFNRALKARVEAYRATLLACGAACWTRARSALDSSFLSVPADTLLKDAVDSVGTATMLAGGAYYDFGTGSGDLTHGLFDPTGLNERGHPSLRTQAETQANGQRDRRFLDKIVAVPPPVRAFN